MSHTCTTALVRCIDFRLESAIEEYMSKNGLTNDTDVISYAGAAKDLNQESNIVEDQLLLSNKLHDTKTIILMNHTDCGGYGGREAFESLEAEREHHISELNKAKERVLAKMDNVEVKTVLADIKEDGSIVIKEV